MQAIPNKVDILLFLFSLIPGPDVSSHNTNTALLSSGNPCPAFTMQTTARVSYAHLRYLQSPKTTNNILYRRSTVNISGISCGSKGYVFPYLLPFSQVLLYWLRKASAPSGCHPTMRITLMGAIPLPRKRTGGLFMSLFLSLFFYEKISNLFPEISIFQLRNSIGQRTYLLVLCCSSFAAIIAFISVISSAKSSLTALHICPLHSSLYASYICYGKFISNSFLYKTIKALLMGDGVNCRLTMYLRFQSYIQAAFIRYLRLITVSAA